MSDLISTDYTHHESLTTDLISREDAIEAVAKAKATDPFGRYDKQNIGIDWALDALESLPSAEAVQGEWVQMDLLADRLCSICGYGVWDSEAEEYNFCPNCGARMYKCGDSE